MPESPGSPLTPLLDRLQGDRGRLAGRYLIVSVVNVVNHQVILYVANTLWGWPAGWANVFAACIAAIPAYFMSRAWVWEVTGKHDLRAEIIPFWALAIIGLIVSTALAAGAGRAFGDGLLVNLASLVGYFIVWLAKFLLLDELFTPSGSEGE